MLKYALSIIILISFAPNGFSGFISSNGLSLPTGMECVEWNYPNWSSKLQLKLDPKNGSYTLRRVLAQNGSPHTVTVLHEGLSCEASRYTNEPNIENRCKNGLISVEVIPHRDRIIVVSGENFTKNQSWYKFPADACSVKLDEKILP